MNYTFLEENGIKSISIPTQTVYGTICFSWDDSEFYSDFKKALDLKGLDCFVEMILQNPENAFVNFCSN
jgi:hypothetical protein